MSKIIMRSILKSDGSFVTRISSYDESVSTNDELRKKLSRFRHPKITKMVKRNKTNSLFLHFLDSEIDFTKISLLQNLLIKRIEKIFSNSQINGSTKYILEIIEGNDAIYSRTLGRKH